MKIRDNKKFRNYRRMRELESARDKRENLIGIPIGFKDKFGVEICAGDTVSIESGGSATPQWTGIVLFNKFFQAWCVMRGCWYGERNAFDPRSYGKVDYIFNGKPRKLDDIKVSESVNA